jgi:hypothetical protein
MKDNQLLYKGSTTSKVSLILYYSNMTFLIHNIIVVNKIIKQNFLNYNTKTFYYNIK